MSRASTTSSWRSSASRRRRRISPSGKRRGGAARTETAGHDRAGRQVRALPRLLQDRSSRR
jgi:hypothetical protein